MPRRSLPIRQLPSRRWQARPAGVDPATFDTYEDAEAWCLEKLTARSRGVAPPRGTAKITVRDYGEEWEPAQPWAPATRQRHEASFKRWIYPAFGDIAIVRLRPTQMQGFITSLDGQLAPGTQRLVLQHLNELLNAAVVDGIRPDNPAARARLPRGDAEEIIVPTVEQVHALAEVIRPSSRALIAVGAGLGLRQGEAFALTRTAVDFMREVVHVRAKLRSDRGRLVIDDTTKTGKARTVPLPKTVAAELAAHIEQHDSGHPDGLLFTSQQGFKIRHGEWNVKIWRPAALQVGLDASYHSLRHFCVTSMLRRHVSVAAVAKTLGDTQQTVIKYYSHWIDDDTDLIRGVLDDVLTTPGNVDDKAV
jgi:integrase